ncbi:hypothetical protein AB0M36_34610 [Actinoplanes sp. NPDC051346]|uniref:hypothetical protein n=1 Tax=Actinoplanes sp. NPDC051346 TaxID=3155048 RepID=UPI003441386E
MDILILIATVLALGSGAVTFLVVRPDFRPGRAVTISVGTGLVVGLGFFAIIYLVVGAFLAAVVTYLVVRRVTGVTAAAVAGAAVLLAAGLASAALLYASLTTM